jgi:hypothetical protein
MKARVFLFVVMLVAFSLVGLTGSSLSSSEKLKADDIVARSLDAIGAKEARSTLSSLSIEGNAHVQFLMGGSGEAGGPFTLDSWGHKFMMQTKFDIPSYPGEAYAFDGEKKSIGSVAPGQRSQLEDFLNNNGEIVDEGLIGGILTTAWPLYDWQARKARLSSDGLKKEEGKELYRLTYQPRHGGGDLKIYLFFDPETFRHVKTVYTQQVASQMGTTPGHSSSGGLTRVTLEESFGGFTKVGDLTLPTQWMLKYSSEVYGYGTSILEYDFAVGKVTPNTNLSAKSFKIQ